MSISFSKFKLQKAYFLLLLPVFFVFHGFTENYHLIDGGDCLLLLLNYLLVSVCISLVIFILFRSWRKAAVFTFFLMSFNFFFGSIHDLLKSWLPDSFLVSYTFIIPLSLILFIVLGIYLAKTKKQFIRFTKYVNLVLILFVLIDLVQLSVTLSKTKKETTVLPTGFINCDSCSKPDIYFIIADEYAGHRELQNIFHFDNSAFENALRQRGFYIVNNSIGNYNYTPFCIASIFSINFLSGIEGRNKSKTDRQVCYQLINQNQVTNFLQSQGYELKNLSVFKFGEELPVAHSSFFLTGKDLLSAQTFLSRVNRDIRFNFVTKFKIQSEIKRMGLVELNSLTTLFTKTKEEATKQNNKPQFIYTHLMMPHYPYFFDKNGKINSPNIALEGKQVLQKEYIEYLQYCNAKFLELIDHILKNSKKPPIIIFMGDHGFRHFEQGKDVDHNYYFMNLNSVYLPGKNYSKFYDGMSSVNEFRVLFNSQFNQHLTMLKDSTIFLKE